MAAIAATLARYNEDVITAATHPVSGLPSKKSWLPTVKEVHTECEELDEFRQQNEARQKRIAEQLELRRQEDEARARRPTYDELKAKHGDTWGINQPPSAAVDPDATKKAAQRNERIMLDEYADRGMEPRYTKAGELISPSLVLQILGTAELEDHIARGFSPGTAAYSEK